MNREQREKLLKIDVKQLQNESCGLSLAVYGLLSDEQKKMQNWDNLSAEEREKAVNGYKLYRLTVQDTLDAWKENAETDDLYAIGCREMRRLLHILPKVE